MPQTRKLRIKKNQLHAPGDIVFAKLRGYPWWPAKIQDETKVPKHVLQTKKKKKVSSDASTVFFFGSLDYAFISEKLIRAFDPEAVRQGILDDKFKNRELVSALEQALDPHGLDFLFKTQKQQPTKRKKIERSHTSMKTSLPTGTEQTKASSTATATTTTTEAAAPTAAVTVVTRSPPTANRKEHSPSPSTRRTLKRAMDVDAETDTNNKKRCKSTSAKSIKGRPIIAISDNRRPFSYTSKSLESACQKSPEYERHFKRMYVMRHKLQNLIYGKKPGETPPKDYPKIAAILTDIENYDITKELLKETQIGKIVRFGCDYQFGADDTYKLQERCLAIMKTWATTLLDLTEHHNPKSPTETSPAKPVSFASTTSTPSSGMSVANEADEANSSVNQHGETMDNDHTHDTWLVEKEEHVVDIETTNSMTSPVLDTQQTDYECKENSRSAFISTRNKATMASTTTEKANGLIKDGFIAPSISPVINNVLDDDETPETSIPSIPPIGSNIYNIRESEPLPTNSSTESVDNVNSDEDHKHDEATKPPNSMAVINDNIAVDIEGHSSLMVSVDDNTDGASDTPPLITQTQLTRNPITVSHQNDAHGVETSNNNDTVTQKTISSGDESKSQKQSFYDMSSTTPAFTNNPVSLPQPLGNKHDNEEWQHQHHHQK